MKTSLKTLMIAFLMAFTATPSFAATYDLNKSFSAIHTDMICAEDDKKKKKKGEEEEEPECD